MVLRIEEEVRRTDMVFSNVDYLEATRYLALNWSQEDCRSSCLRRVLPWSILYISFPKLLGKCRGISSEYK